MICTKLNGTKLCCHTLYMILKYWQINCGQSRNTLRWRHNECDGVSNHQLHNCLLKRLFGRRSKEISKLRVTGLCAGNSPVTGKFPAQRASNAENVSIWWRHHELLVYLWNVNQRQKVFVISMSPVFHLSTFLADGIRSPTHLWRGTCPAAHSYSVTISVTWALQQWRHINASCIICHKWGESTVTRLSFEMWTFNKR